MQNINKRRIRPGDVIIFNGGARATVDENYCIIAYVASEIVQGKLSVPLDKIRDSVIQKVVYNTKVYEWLTEKDVIEALKVSSIDFAHDVLAIQRDLNEILSKKLGSNAEDFDPDSSSHDQLVYKVKTQQAELSFTGKYLDALDEKLITGPQTTLSAFKDPKEALNHLITWEIQVATDPDVSDHPAAKALGEKRERENSK